MMPFSVNNSLFAHFSLGLFALSLQVYHDILKYVFQSEFFLILVLLS